MWKILGFRVHPISLGDPTPLLGDPMQYPVFAYPPTSILISEYYTSPNHPGLHPPSPTPEAPILEPPIPNRIPIASFTPCPISYPPLQALPHPRHQPPAPPWPHLDTTLSNLSTPPSSTLLPAPFQVPPSAPPQAHLLTAPQTPPPASFPTP